MFFAVTAAHMQLYLESEVVAGKLAKSLGASAKVEMHSNQKRALAGADFVVVAFQIGGFEPCTVTDFEVPKKYGLRQTIADGLVKGRRAFAALSSHIGAPRPRCPVAKLVGTPHTADRMASAMMSLIDAGVLTLRASIPESRDRRKKIGL